MTADSLADQVEISDEEIGSIKKRLAAAESEAIESVADEAAYKRASEKTAAISLELQKAQQMRERRNLAYEDRNSNELAKFNAELRQAKNEIIALRNKFGFQSATLRAEALATPKALNLAVDRENLIHDHAIMAFDRLSEIVGNSSLAIHASQLVQLLKLHRERHRISLEISTIDDRCRLEFNEWFVSGLRGHFAHCPYPTETMAMFESLIKKALKESAAIEAKVKPLQGELDSVNQKIGEIMASLSAS